LTGNTDWTDGVELKKLDIANSETKNKPTGCGTKEEFGSAGCGSKED